MRQTATGLILFATATALSACGQSTKESAAATGTVSLTNASMGEVGEQVAAANKGGAMFDPGHWEGTVKILDMAIPGMGAGLENLPPEMAARLKARMSQGNAFASCLTPDEAANAREALTKNQRGDCTYDHFTMAGGTIDAAMSCKVGTALQKMTMTGTYSRTDYHLVSQASGGEGPHGAMAMKMEITAHRTGACTGKEDEKGGAGE